MQNQSYREIIFDTQLKTALCLKERKQILQLLLAVLHGRVVSISSPFSHSPRHSVNVFLSFVDYCSIKSNQFCCDDCFAELFTAGKKELSVIQEVSQESANTSMYPLKNLPLINHSFWKRRSPKL